MTNLNMIFYVVVLVYRFVKIWNSPQFPAEFRNDQLDEYIYRSTEADATNRNPTPVTTVTIPYIKGTSETVWRIAYSPTTSV